MVKVEMSKIFVISDTKDTDVLKEVVYRIVCCGGSLIKSISTPNGYHIVSGVFDTKTFQNEIMNTYKGLVEIKRDAQYFIDRIIIE